MEQRQSFSEWCWSSWTPRRKQMNLDPHLTLFTNINSKWVRDPNVKRKTMRLLENNIGENLDGFGYDDLKKNKKTKKTESCELSEETSAMSQFVFGRIHTSSGRPWGSINTMEGNCTFSDNNFVIWEYFPTFTSLFSLPVMHYL